MKALEDAERARMELEDEYARVRANLLEELSLVKAERDAFREKCEVCAHQSCKRARSVSTSHTNRVLATGVAE
jgi:hypothetical protein